MNITKVTITGADDNTDIADLFGLSQKYPFVEWGILFSPTRWCTNRYPSQLWVQRLTMAKYDDALQLSAHLCGKFTSHLLTKGDTYPDMADLTDLLDNFDRFQLNFNARKHIVSSKFYDIFRDAKEEYTEKFIIQYNKANLDVCNEIIKINPPNVHFLYDSSGGRGVMPESYSGVISNPITEQKYYTGYSGGLNPDNIQEALVKIERAAGDSAIWVDTETGIRTNDKLDLNKVETFLQHCKPYVKEAKNINA